MSEAVQTYKGGAIILDVCSPSSLRATPWSYALQGGTRKGLSIRKGKRPPPERGVSRGEAIASRVVREEEGEQLPPPREEVSKRDGQEVEVFYRTPRTSGAFSESFHIFVMLYPQC